MKGKQRKSNYSKGRKPNFKGKDIRKDQEDSDFEKKGKRSSSTNDIDWYSQTPELLRDAASVPFSRPTGLPFRVMSSINDRTSNVEYTTPGIFTYQIMPLPGSFSSRSALNTAATALYSFVRHANSGHSNYDAPDLMMYCVAMGQIYSFINYCQRVYGSANLYSMSNRYLPKALVTAQDVDFDDVIANLAQFRYGINSLIYKASAFACPSSIKYFERLAFMFSGIYAEGEDVKSQLYMYTPRGFLKYEEKTSTSGSYLSPQWFAAADVPNASFTVAQLITYGNNLIQPLLASEDIGIMSGDILKAYGTDGILKLMTLSEDYMVMPTTDLTVLEQMQNSVAPWGLAEGGAGKAPINVCLYQDVDTNSILSRLAYAQNNKSQALYSITENSIINTILTQPEAADVMERTRGKFTMNDDPDSTTSLPNQIIMQASEVVVGFSYFKIMPDGSITQRNFGSVIETDSMTVADIISHHSDLEVFKFHPAVYYISAPTWGDPITLQGIALDFDNYTVISSNVLDTINDAAMLSLFRVPNVATAYK